jgi:hypothetical protein
MREYIPKADLVHGEYYGGHCRNAQVARWDATVNKFFHWRTKFGETFIEEICHPDDEKRYDVFYPVAVQAYITKAIPLAKVA